MRPRTGRSFDLRESAVARGEVAAVVALAVTLVIAVTLPASEVRLLPKLWKSQTTGNQYRVEVSGDIFRADWVKLSAVLARQGAYLHTECHRQGEKWIGMSSSRLPCSVGEGPGQHLAQFCKVETHTEIDSISPDRITGHGQTLKKVDCQTCKILETGWAAWTWTPAK